MTGKRSIKVSMPSAYTTFSSKSISHDVSKYDVATRHHTDIGFLLSHGFRHHCPRDQMKMSLCILEILLNIFVVESFLKLNSRCLRDVQEILFIIIPLPLNHFLRGVGVTCLLPYRFISYRVFSQETLFAVKSI